MPDDVRFPLVAAGGPDGLAVTAPLLQRLPELLHRDGTAVVVGLLPGAGDGPDLARLAAIADTAELEILVIATAEHSIEPDTDYLGVLVETAQLYEPDERAGLEERISRSFAELGATAMYRSYLVVRRTRGPGHVRLTGHWLRGGQGWHL
jgi:hypothetical protein